MLGEGAHRSQDGWKEGGRDHYLSAPGGEAATFGGGGRAGGFELNYRTKKQNKQKNRTRKTNDKNEHGDIKTQTYTREDNDKLGEVENVDCETYLTEGQVEKTFPKRLSNVNITSGPMIFKQTCSAQTT